MNSETKVVNLRTDKYTHYIGRGSLFGNPFKIGRDGTRDEVVEKYRVWFNSMLENPKFKEAVLLLKGETLGCYCRPERCHGDIIKEYLDEQCS